MTIRNIAINEYAEAVSLFTEAFADDPLFVFAFPVKEKRIRQTRIMYEFVVNDMVPGLRLRLVGAYEGAVMTGCMIYTTPDSNEWNEEMGAAVQKMREVSGDERIRLIGEYATLEGFDPQVPHFYGNELAVKKEFRKMGIGSSLCQFLINECKSSASAKGIIIDTANNTNLALYLKLGWVLKTTVPFYESNKFFLWRSNSIEN